MARFNKMFVKKLYMPDGKDKSQLDKMAQVTASATELNIMDGVTATAAEINSLDFALQSAEHGAGAISTAFAPRTYRYTKPDGTIVTEIHIDLTGLKAKGDAADDVIGLAAGAAYIGRYVTATWGIPYRAEVICLELPAGTNITTDIDFAFNASGALIYDGAAGAAELDLGGVVAGAMYSDDVLGLTANDYLYIVEGDAAATAGTYTAGQFILRFYGHALLS